MWVIPLSAYEVDFQWYEELSWLETSSAVVDNHNVFCILLPSWHSTTAAIAAFMTIESNDLFCPVHRVHSLHARVGKPWLTCQLLSTGFAGLSGMWLLLHANRFREPLVRAEYHMGTNSGWVVLKRAYMPIFFRYIWKYMVNIFQIWKYIHYIQNLIWIKEGKWTLFTKLIFIFTWPQL